MNNRWIFALAAAGVLAGLGAAYVLSERHRPAAPLFDPTPNPYGDAIYANGIIESRQGSGQNLNLYPEVGATVRKVLVDEGAQVRAGQPLIELDASVQRATTEQLKLQAEAAGSALQALRAQPRKEQLDVARAQVDQAQAALRTYRDQYSKMSSAHAVDPGAVSQDALDSAANQTRQAQAALALAQRQYDLTRAGAWVYDIRAQEQQYRALNQAFGAAQALLDKYTVRAPADGTVLAIGAAPGAYVSAQGVYAAYTQSQTPVVVMSREQSELAVRCYVDEILIHRLPGKGRMRAQMTVRGTDLRIPLVFDHIQPYVTPKLELSDQRQERVDLRVLPVIFRFKPPAAARLYPGQLVDVYIAGDMDGSNRPSQAASAPAALGKG